jgi:selT/selW/selH-like putative selenoprotein
MEREFAVPIRLRAGAPGSLDVFVDGEQIYSKRRTGRFPTANELIESIRSRVAG